MTQDGRYLQPPGSKAHSSRSAMKYQLEDDRGTLANGNYREAVVEARPIQERKR